MGVAIPPIDALKAIDNINAFPKILFSFSAVLFKSFIFFMIAIPIGNIITAVAVFEIHIDKNAVAIINPRITFLTSVPIMLTILSAILL